MSLIWHSVVTFRNSLLMLVPSNIPFLLLLWKFHIFFSEAFKEIILLLPYILPLPSSSKHFFTFSFYIFHRQRPNPKCLYFYWQPKSKNIQRVQLQPSPTFNWENFCSSFGSDIIFWELFLVFSIFLVWYLYTYKLNFYLWSYSIFHINFDREVLVRTHIWT